MSRVLAIFFGVGLLRPAPGTWGSAVAVVLGVLIYGYLGFAALLVATIVITGLGFWAVGRELAGREKLGGGGDDPSEFVIDEVAGQWIALLIPAAAFWWRGSDGFLPYPAPLAAFLFFRLFDIWKPWLVGRADARHDAAGVMLDDLWAGLFAGITTVLVGVFYHVILFA